MGRTLSRLCQHSGCHAQARLASRHLCVPLNVSLATPAGHTPLHLAAAQQHALMVHALLLAGAQHSAQDAQGW